MTEITLKIDEKTKAGKAFMAVLQFFNSEKKGVEVIHGTFKESGLYNVAFLEKIKKAEGNIKKGKTIQLNPDDIWGSIL